jgi:hypothetical protein
MKNYINPKSQHLPNLVLLATNADIFFARGIVAEPLAKSRSDEASDGANSPTRAGKAREAARPNYIWFALLYICPNLFSFVAKYDNNETT